MTVMLTNLPDVLRKSGVEIETEPGWETRSAAPRGGRYGGPGLDAVLTLVMHHTGANPATPGNYPSRDTILNGNSSTKGFLSQIVTGRDGTGRVFGAGIAWHAGLTKNPKIEGNRFAIGNEIEHSGSPYEPYRWDQYQAIVLMTAALQAEYPAAKVLSHMEISRAGKTDPIFDMDVFRADVADPTRRRLIAIPDGRYVASLRKGAVDSNGWWHVTALQVTMQILGAKSIKADGDFGDNTETALIELQERHELEADGVAGPAWRAKANGLIATLTSPHLDVRDPKPLPTPEPTPEPIPEPEPTPEPTPEPEPEPEPEPALPPNPSLGEVSPRAGRWQATLVRLGSSEVIDNKFGPGTQSDTVKLQRIMDVEADGIPGPDTLGAANELITRGVQPLAERAERTPLTIESAGSSIRWVTAAEYKAGVGSRTFGRALERELEDRTFKVYCGPTEQFDRKTCYWPNHRHSRTSIHFIGPWAIDVGIGNAPVSTYEKAHLDKLVRELRQRFPELIGKIVWNRGAGDHEDHAHLQGVRLKTVWRAIRYSGKKAKLSEQAFPANRKDKVYKARIQMLRVRLGDGGTVTKVIELIVGAKKDGLLDVADERLVQSWQKDIGVPDDGIVGPNTLIAALRKHGTIRRGDSNLMVRLMQLCLGVPPDGVFGPGTEARLKTAQRAAGLPDDGIFGEDSRNNLIK